MNTLIFLAAANDAPIMLKIFFWVLIGLCALGIIAKPENPAVVRGGGIVVLVLLAILGYYVFGF